MQLNKAYCNILNAESDSNHRGFNQSTLWSDHGETCEARGGAQSSVCCPLFLIGQVDLLFYQLLQIVALLELDLHQTIMLGPWTLTCPDHVHSKWCFTRRRCKHVLFHTLIVMPSTLSDNDTDNTVRVFVVIFCIVMHDYCVIHSNLNLVSWCVCPE